MTTARRSLITSLLLLLAASAPIWAQSPAAYRADAERFLEALHAGRGATVCEIGAGGGEVTVHVAKAVGETGRVFSNELSAERREQIEKAARDAGLSNVTVVEGKSTDANIPRETCDGLLMRDVYHHFVEPPPMNTSLLAALKPGGRIAIIDFTPPPGHQSATPGDRARDGQHGILPDTLVRELREAGFADLSSQWIDGRMFMVTGVRPPQGAGQSCGG